MDAILIEDNNNERYGVSIHAPVMDAITCKAKGCDNQFSFNPRARDGRDYK